MGLSQCRPGRDRSVHPACRVRVCNVNLRPSSAPCITNDSRSFQKELLGPEVRNLDRDEASRSPAMSAVVPKAEVKSGYCHLPRWAFARLMVSPGA